MFVISVVFPFIILLLFFMYVLHHWYVYSVFNHICFVWSLSNYVCSLCFSLFPLFDSIRSSMLCCHFLYVCIACVRVCVCLVCLCDCNAVMIISRVLFT